MHEGISLSSLYWGSRKGYSRVGLANPKDCTIETNQYYMLKDRYCLASAGRPIVVQVRMVSTGYVKMGHKESIVSFMDLFRNNKSNLVSPVPYEDNYMDFIAHYKQITEEEAKEEIAMYVLSIL